MTIEVALFQHKYCCRCVKSRRGSVTVDNHVRDVHGNECPIWVLRSTFELEMVLFLFCVWGGRGEFSSRFGGPNPPWDSSIRLPLRGMMGAITDV